ncbi:MAG: type II toxin-antitoxin system mRNA interferase toxin, RelE/StbE family [Patescibacteria group bacterium]|nr:type II toxin-antitoxin system mRNA interferase toxin, RelE/StbE family [Patescibacteria group bacterium]
MRIEIHRDAQKQLSKSSPKIKKKAEILVSFVLESDSLEDFPFDIKSLRGDYKIYKEILIDKDYRIFFYIENDTFYIRYAGTHNYLGTG